MGLDHSMNSHVRNQTKIIIVGAGLCGTWLFQRLKDHVDVTVVEKSKGLGGRIASRRYTTLAGEVTLNHGAHHFLARDLENHPWFQELQKNKYIEPAMVTHGYRFVGAATASFKHLWQDYRSSLKLDWKVSKVERLGTQWVVTSEAGEVLECEHLIFTSPVPRSLALTLPFVTSTEQRTLGRVQYLKRIIYVIKAQSPGNDETLKLDFASDEESEQCFEWSDEPLKQQRPNIVDVKKWRYETLAQGIMGPRRYLKAEAEGLWFAGDAFVSYSRPETWGVPTAILSADATAEAINEKSR
jgi:predicted NAD/FAD-dependent oxidoreductase